MASARYTLNISEEDLKPEQPPEQTPQEKRSNWFFYHKWQIFGIAFLLILVVWFIYDMVTKVDFDYNIALITASNVSDETITSLENALTPYFEDANGDGEVHVNVSHYTYHYGDDDINANLDPNVKMAGEIQLSTDFSTSTSVLFITDCFEGLEDSVSIFGLLDDPYAYPTDEQRTQYDKLSLAWTDSALLTGLPLEGYANELTTGEEVDPQEFFSNFRICMRTLYDPEDEELVTVFNNCVSFMQKVRGIEA